MPRRDLFEPLLLHHVEREVEAVVKGYGRRKRRLAADRVGFRLADVEVVLRHLRTAVSLPGARAQGNEGEAGRDHESLLRSRRRDIDIPGIRREGQAAEAAYSIDDYEDFRFDRPYSAGDGSNVVR